MSNSYEGSSKFDHSDPDKLRIAPVYSRSEQEQELISDPYFTVTCAIQHKFLSMLQEKADQLEKEATAEMEITESELYKALETLKTLFHNLMLVDVSPDYLFAEALSNNWRILIEAIKWRKTPPHLAAFLSHLKNYPPGVEHSLGYYLSNYAGKKWIPFPLIDMLSALHQNALLEKSHSILNVWILSICEIIDEL